MATQINSPIPQNPIGENFAWRDWLQKLSNKVYGSMANQDSGSVVITGGSINGTTIGSSVPSTGKFTTLDATTTRTTNLLVGSGTNGQILVGRTSDHAFLPTTLGSGTGIGITAGAGSMSIANTGVTSAVAGTGIGVSAATGAVTFTNSGVTSFTSSSGLSTNTSATGAVSVTNTGVTSIIAGTGISVSSATGAVTISQSSTTTKAYGSFYDTTTQTAAAINTAYAMTFDTTALSSGVSRGSPTSRIVVTNAGVYNFQFSAQLHKTSASVGYVYIWFRVNGTDITDSASKVALNGSQAETIAAWNYIASMAASDYFQIMWSTDSTACQLLHNTTVSPVPGIPSIILTVQQI